MPRFMDIAEECHRSLGRDIVPPDALEDIDGPPVDCFALRAAAKNGMRPAMNRAGRSQSSAFEKQSLGLLHRPPDRAGDDIGQGSSALLDQAPQGGAADLQALGCGGLVAVGLGQDPQCHIPADLLQRLAQIQGLEHIAHPGGVGVSVGLPLQDLADTLGGDGLLCGGGQFLDHPLELDVIMGPGEGLQQLDRLRLGAQHRIGPGGVQKAQGGGDLGGDLLLEIPQRPQVQNAAVQAVQEFGALRGHLLAGAAGTGEEHPVAAADIRLRQRVHQL